jgi:integrase
VDQQPGARSVLQVVRAARRAAGLSRIRLHDVRHGYATAALPAGIPAKIVSERLGPASVAITMGTYSHVLPGLAELILGNHARKASDDKSLTRGRRAARKGREVEGELPVSGG